MLIIKYIIVTPKEKKDYQLLLQTSPNWEILNGYVKPIYIKAQQAHLENSDY